MTAIETVSKMSKYQRLERAFARVANRWEEKTIELYGSPGTREVFLSMAESALQQAFREFPTWPFNWRVAAQDTGEKPKGALFDGVRVLALYNHYACLAAGYHGMSIGQLEVALADPLSFCPLIDITEQPSKIAGRVEVEHGLDSAIYDDGVNLIQQRRYVVKNGAITLPSLKLEIARQRRIASESIVLDGGGCHAHHAGQLENIYYHFVRISLGDSRLAAASLARATRVHAEAAKPS